MLGLKEREIGLYVDSVNLPNGSESNIYTAFRAMVDDFTLPGALLFFGLLSFAGGLGWALLRHGQLWAAPFLVSDVAFILWSPLTSLFNYNSIVGALFLFELVMVYVTLVGVARSPVRAVVYATA
jgi:hypothetical protein